MKILAVLAILVGSVALAAPERPQEISAKGLPRGCSVYLWPGSQVSGGRCVFSDSVMTGIQSVDPLVIRCSRIEVRCTRPKSRPIEKKG